MTCAAQKNVVLCSAGEKQMSLNLLISCGGVIATLSIARSATGRMLVKSVWAGLSSFFRSHTKQDRVILKEWLKSGYMEKHVLHESHLLCELFRFEGFDEGSN